MAGLDGGAMVWGEARRSARTGTRDPPSKPQMLSGRNRAPAPSTQAGKGSSSRLRREARFQLPQPGEFGLEKP